MTHPILRTLASILFAALALAAPRSAHAQAPDWSPLGSFHGGAVNRLVHTPWGATFAATGGGIFRSDDSGVSWQYSGVGMLRTNALELVIGPYNELITALYTGSLPDLFRSDDSGATWTEIDGRGFSGPGFINTRGLAIDRRTWAIYVATTKGLFRNDGVNSWRHPDTTSDFHHLCGIDSGVVALTRGGITRLYGYSAQQRMSERPKANLLAVAADGSLVVHEPGDGGGSILRSTDDGETFHLVGSSLATEPPVESLVAGSTDEIVAGHARGDISTSRDGGATWTRASYGAYFINDAVTYGNGVIVAATSNGSARSIDHGLSFHHASNGINARPVRVLASIPGQPVYAQTWLNDLHRTTDAGRTWVDLSALAPYSFSRFAIADDGTLYAGERSVRKIVRSLDSGATWTDISVPTGPAISSIAAWREHVYFAASLERTVWHSTDRGATWREGATMASGPVLSMSVDSAGALIAETFARIYRSTDHGATWNVLDSPTPAREFQIAPDGTTYCAAGYLSIIRFAPDGTWDTLKVDSLRSEVTEIAVDHAGRIFVLGHFGDVAMSTDRGETWEHWTVEEVGALGTSLSLADSTVYIGTMTAGVIRFTRGVVEPAEPEKPELPTPPVPSASSIVSVTPNPTTGSGSVYFDIAQQSTIALELYNEAGELIWVLASGDRAPGRYHASLGGIDVADGVYMLSLRAGDTRDVEKIVVIR